MAILNPSHALANQMRSELTEQALKNCPNNLGYLRHIVTSYFQTMDDAFVAILHSDAFDPDGHQLHLPLAFNVPAAA